MDHDIQLISDGDGLAVIGEPAAVDRFLASEGLSAEALDLRRLRGTLSTGATIAQSGAEVASNSGRWVKLTKESAQLVKKHGLREDAKTGLSTGVVKGNKGQIGGFVKFVKSPRSVLTNPSLLAGAAGVMAQIAMQQTMDEITDYLATIDEKLDDVLRAHEDAVVADMIGAGLDIEEAMTIRDHGGRVNEVTWSKVQGTSATIARTQAYALRQLDGIAEKVERKTKVGDLAKSAKEAESKAHNWLAVLARCFQLQDAIAVLELEHVMDSAPADLEGHRLGLKAARQKRLDVISRSTNQLTARMGIAAEVANSKVLLHPSSSPAVVRSSAHLSAAVADLHGCLGIESGLQELETRRWKDAATDARQSAIKSGAGGLDAAKRLGAETVHRTKAVPGKVSSRLPTRSAGRGDPEGERDRDQYERNTQNELHG